MTDGEYYGELKKKTKEMQGRLTISKASLDYIQSDIIVIKELIKKKEEKLKGSLDALNFLKDTIQKKERELAETATKYDALIQKLDENPKNIESLSCFDGSKVAIEIVHIKQELRNFSNDLNIQCLGEAAVLDLIIENKKLMLKIINNMLNERMERGSNKNLPASKQAANEGKKGLEVINNVPHDYINKVKEEINKLRTLQTEFKKKFTNTFKEETKHPSPLSDKSKDKLLVDREVEECDIDDEHSGSSNIRLDGGKVKNNIPSEIRVLKPRDSKSAFSGRSNVQTGTKRRADHPTCGGCGNQGQFSLCFMCKKHLCRSCLLYKPCKNNRESHKIK